MDSTVLSGTGTVPRLFWKRVEEWADRTAMREKVENGLWREISWRE